MREVYARCPLDAGQVRCIWPPDGNPWWDGECKNARCHRFTKGVVYGLLDARIGDIFYVGSTVQRPGVRYSDHLGGRRLYNMREAWIMAILADGSLPIFLSLGEIFTPCELELKLAEKEIAESLRAQGHTALCDFSTLFLHDRISATANAESGSEARWGSIEQAIAEYLDLMNGQAHTRHWLRELWEET